MRTAAVSPQPPPATRSTGSVTVALSILGRSADFPVCRRLSSTRQPCSELAGIVAYKCNGFGLLRSIHRSHATAATSDVIRQRSRTA